MKKYLIIIILLVFVFIAGAAYAKVCPYKAALMVENISGIQEDAIKKYGINIKLNSSWFFYASYDFPEKKKYLFDTYLQPFDYTTGVFDSGIALSFKKVEGCNSFIHILIGNMTEDVAHTLNRYRDKIKDKEILKDMTDGLINGNHVLVIRGGDNRYSVFVFESRTQIQFITPLPSNRMLELLEEIIPVLL